MTWKKRVAKYISYWFEFFLNSIYGNIRLALERIKRRICSPAPPKNEDDKVYIHLGCGEINVPGFINIDAVPFSHVHYVQEVKDLSIFPDKYANLIYASHVLEHISYGEVPKVLNEWRRVLKKGGVLRISVPDFDKLVKVYQTEEKSIQAIIMALMGAQNYEYNFHKTIFNEKYLTELLLSAGFKEVRSWNPREIEMHDFEDWASRPIKVKEREYLISLNLEGVK